MCCMSIDQNGGCSKPPKFSLNPFSTFNDVDADVDVDVDVNVDVNVDVDVMGCIVKEGTRESDIDEIQKKQNYVPVLDLLLLHVLLFTFYQWCIMHYYYFFYYNYYFNLDSDAESAFFLFMTCYDCFERFDSFTKNYWCGIGEKLMHARHAFLTPVVASGTCLGLNSSKSEDWIRICVLD